MKKGFLKSIRIRLTAWYTVAFLVTTFVTFTAFYFTTRAALFDHTDNTLNIYSGQIVDIVNRDRLLDANQMLDDLNNKFGDMPGASVVIINSDGKTVGGSFVSTKNSDLYLKLFNKSREETVSFFENDKAGDLNMRFLVVPIRDGSSFRGAVIVGHSIDVIEKSLEALVWELAIVLLCLAIPGVMGGYVMARGAMSPVAKITNKLKVIDSKNLNEKIPNPGTGDELEELAETFNDLLDRLQDAFRRERQFIGDVAHELKTPLAIMKSRIEIFFSKDRSKDEYQREFLENLADVDKLTQTLKDILDLAWSESDQAKLKLDKINLSELTEELRELTINMASKKKIVVISRINEKIFVQGKKEKLSRALVNFVDNAVKYTDLNGTIEITVARSTKNAIWQIRDNGVGISKNDLPHIFDRFYRGSKNNVATGSGLGLAIAKAIINAHDGKIEAWSKLKEGTTIRVTLPLG